MEDQELSNRPELEEKNEEYEEDSDNITTPEDSFNIYEGQSEVDIVSESQRKTDNEPTDINNEEVNSEDSFDENEDFPEYANEKNKELNEKVKETKKHIKKVNVLIDETKERYTLLSEHYKNVKEVKQFNYTFNILCCN